MPLETTRTSEAEMPFTPAPEANNAIEASILNSAILDGEYVSASELQRATAQDTSEEDNPTGSLEPHLDSSTHTEEDLNSSPTSEPDVPSEVEEEKEEQEERGKEEKEGEEKEEEEESEEKKNKSKQSRNLWYSVLVWLLLAAARHRWNSSDLISQGNDSWEIGRNFVFCIE